ncbi:hypothetical protein ACJRO7_017778 [Eucalyptus globulus]|uniref:Uncharacterized protein n=1 Tax=Eucalyptus globulus TaxID=34317 RepID=A0ABD3KVS1_EUCGL
MTTLLQPPTAALASPSRLSPKLSIAREPAAPPTSPEQNASPLRRHRPTRPSRLLHEPPSLHAARAAPPSDADAVRRSYRAAPSQPLACALTTTGTRDASSPSKPHIHLCRRLRRAPAPCHTPNLRSTTPTSPPLQPA